MVIARRAARDGLERQNDTPDGHARLTSAAAAAPATPAASATPVTPAMKAAAVLAAVRAVSGGGGVCGGVGARGPTLEPTLAPTLEPTLEPVQSQLEGLRPDAVGRRHVLEDEAVGPKRRLAGLRVGEGSSVLHAAATPAERDAEGRGRRRTPEEATQRDPAALVRQRRQVAQLEPRDGDLELDLLLLLLLLAMGTSREWLQCCRRRGDELLLLWLWLLWQLWLLWLLLLLLRLLLLYLLRLLRLQR